MFYTHLMQMEKYSEKLPEGIGQARKATVPFETGNCLITNDILDNTVQHTN
jgi:hypothetical protein